MTETIPTGRRGLWAPMRIRSFLYLWSAQSFSLLGDGFSSVAFAWITVTISGSSLAVGVVLASQAVPRALLTLVGGALSDRISPRSMMRVSSILRAALMVMVASVGFAYRPSLWILVVAAALFGAVDAFFQPARASILPSVVPPEQLEPANALLNAASRVAMVIGPALGGVVIAAANANVAFLVDGCCFALVATFVSGVPGGSRQSAVGPPGDLAAECTVSVAPPGRRPKTDSLGNRIRTGLSYVWADPRLRAVLVVDAVVTFCYAGPFTVGFTSLVKFRLDSGATLLGMLSGALAAGAITGSLVGGASRWRPRVGLLIAALAAWLAVGMSILGIAANVFVLVTIVALIGVGIGFESVFGVSWIQRSVAPSLLGRVIAVDMVAGYIVAPISLIVSGTLAQPNPGVVFFGTAALLVLTSFGVLCSKPVVSMK